ncbi:MAG: EAL domain-containing protein [Gammaproteobacteria bacterium]|nr:EAL domain-containing protein [Gammaproteobacteria bacterium]
MIRKILRDDPAPLRDAAESKLAKSSVAAAPARTVEDLLHELQVHQIELEMQNESLRQAQLSLEESRDRYVDLYDFAPVGYITLSRDALITEINLTGAALLGVERRNLINRRFASFVAPEKRDDWYRYFAHAIAHDDNQEYSISLQRDDGSRFHARINCQRQIRAGKPPTVRIAITDETDRSNAEEELRIAATAFESHEGMIVTDANGIILRVNQAFVSQTGFSADELVGRTPEFLRSERHDTIFYEQMWKTLRENRSWQGEIWNRHKNGKVYAEWLTISAVTTSAGQITHYVGTFSDITQNSEAAAEIHRLAYYDPLTQLPNRRLLHDRLNQALTASARSGHYGAILFLDLDNFKMLNDTRGHDVGDLLLIEVVRRLHTCTRAGDTLSRLGGDEFIVLLEDLSERAEEAAAQVKQLSNKIINIVEQPYHLKDREYHCTVSIGISLFYDNDETIDALLMHADLAMYKAKNAGRNTTRFFDPEMQLALDRRSTLETCLRHACAREQLQLFYQPQINSRRGIIGAEALLRWRHPDRGLVQPHEFIPLAEETGLILPIAQWVLETACAQIKAWEAHHSTRDLCLAINVSALQFRQVDFTTRIKQTLEKIGANPARLKIELTESLVLDNVYDAITKMQELKAIGVEFSLDDFGTGHSSLSYLKQLPLNQLKIDRSFIRDLPVNSNDAAIVEAIITLGRTFKLNIIAEGVETEAQRDFLQHQGCHDFQGILLSRPVPLDGFERYLELSYG